ncbi:ABC transporter ATP-binding protein [Luteimicrobium album]|uniref:ABC transporter ATP-binding protein n=1 Tax=Luteimicrobium album TaxID=1054550 RepID=A0ABQ6I190_9MICO|nr:ABC transporter ATP-binding protein [Luteimicrobium album]GMA24441.1 ABC transporter ATP-binding protein [Luteimicrobium album]
MSGTARPPAIDVRGLSLSYRDRRTHERRRVLDGVDLTLEAGTTHALVGQSGSGKSTLALAVTGLLPGNAAVEAGTIALQGKVPSRRELVVARRHVLGFVPQDPLSSLDPLQRVGRQLASLLRSRDRSLSRAAAKQRAVELLDQVEIERSAEKYDSYPHQLSGGQLQRVLIAMAISGDPDVLIADEPTSALDVTVQKVILDLLLRLRSSLGLAMLLITHDLALAGERSDAITVLEHGVVRDSGPTTDVLAAPSAAYTRRLLADVPALAPDRFRETGASSPVCERAGDDDPILTVRGLTKSYHDAAGGPNRVLRGVDLTVRRGSTHAIVGESGSGKTTIARILASLTPYDTGEVRFDGAPAAGGGIPIAGPRRLQLISQNPLAVLDPRMTVRQLLEEPLLIHTELTRRERRAEVTALLDRLDLPAELSGRRPKELSGGQRQRVAVGRAIVLAPEVLVLDEPTSALDVSVQANIVELLMDLKARHGLTYVFISHDLGLVRQVSDTVTVLSRGQVVESGLTHEVLARPTHHYTRTLVDSIPGLPHTTRKVLR